MTTYGVLNNLSGAGAAGQAGTVPVSQIPLVCGAELYAEPSVTGLNTQPVDDHCALALLGAVIEQFPIPPGGGLGLARSAGKASRVAHPAIDLELLCTRLLAEGSVALVRADLLGGAGRWPAYAAEGNSPNSSAFRDEIEQPLSGLAVRSRASFCWMAW